MLTNHGQLDCLISCFLDDRKRCDLIEEGAKLKIKAAAIWATGSERSLIAAIEQEYNKLHRPRGSLMTPWGKSVLIKRTKA